MNIAFKIENAANKADDFSNLFLAVIEAAFNGNCKMEEYEASFNFLCNMALEHAEYMKELENEAFAIARGEMVAGKEVT